MIAFFKNCLNGQAIMKSESALSRLERPKSLRCYERSCEVVPGGVNSPVRSFKGLDINPIVIEEGLGDQIYDLDGHSYVDYCGSWGPLIHGHAHPEIVAAAQHRVAKGMTFGIATAVEEKLARTIIKHMPSIEKIRFVSSGTEATMTAARLARGFTGRDLLVKFSGNYHGHADFFLIQAGSGVFGLTATSSSEGIPNDIVRNTACLPYNDTKALKNFLLDPQNKERIAAVIIEPIAGNMGCVPAEASFLRALRDLTRQIGALLIFDEVISGFRVGLGGAQAFYGIVPDLTCLGKIIGGGFPAAAFGGRKEIMDYLAPLGPVYQAGTLSGNPVAMEAGLRSLEMLEVDGFYEELERKTNIITEPVKEFIASQGISACIQQMGSLFTLFFGKQEVRNMEDAKELNTKMFADFFRYMLARGIYLPPSQYEAWFVSQAHTEAHLQKTRDLVLEYLKENFNKKQL
jgi:glutamate-1-semialdehyde 2,1-aminomutase